MNDDFSNQSKLSELTTQLLLATKELVFQNEEKVKRAAELLIANQELIYQNDEKENRAAELLIANQELIYQNAEKEKRAAELLILKDRLFNEKQLFEKTLISIGDGVITTDKNKNITFLNRVAEDLSGWSQKDAYGKPIFDVFSIFDEPTRKRSEDIVSNVMLTKKVHKLANHTILITKDGSEKLIEDSAAPILNEENHVVGVVIVFRDYSEKWERLKKIEYLNFHDDLTGLYNRRFFEEELLRLDTERNYPLTIVMGDINGLKLINDSFGHKIGDDLLKKSAISIKNGCRKDEIIARIGGDEFAIILPNSDEIKAKEIIDRIKLNMKNQEVYGIEVSVSFGFGIKTDNQQDIQSILKQSEDLLYKHKLFESLSFRSKTIDIITKTLFEKNGRELIHSKRVSDLCVLLAERMGFEKDHVNLLKVAGLMHDIGKIGIEEYILNKNGKLTDDEFSEIKRHPEIGSRIVGSVSEFSEIAYCVLQHHERMDGKGYPQGLKGDEICVDARIITLADAYDAMTRPRTYRDIMAKKDAIEEIRRSLGTQFDPHIGEIFIEEVLPYLDD